MKLARIRIGTQTVLCVIDGDAARPVQPDADIAWVDPLREWLAAGQPEPSEVVYSLASSDVLAPVKAPSKIVCIGLNYRDHATEQGKDLPTAPMLFTKSPSSIIGPNDEIHFSPADVTSVDYEAELAVIVGTKMRNVSADAALDHVLGFTVANDVSARDAQQADGQYFRAKSLDTFCPLGPFIVTANELGDIQQLAIRARVNDETRQDGTTADMVFTVADTLAYISRFMTLEPGDVVLTGTPAGVGAGRKPPVFLANGDRVEVEIDGIGTLTNNVVTD